MTDLTTHDACLPGRPWRSTLDDPVIGELLATVLGREAFTVQVHLPCMPVVWVKPDQLLEVKTFLMKIEAVGHAVRSAWRERSFAAPTATACPLRDYSVFYHLISIERQTATSCHEGGAV